MARKEATPVYEESLDPRPGAKAVVMVITTRRGGREGCFWPLTSLLSLFLERVLTLPRHFQDVARSARKADQFRGGKKERDVIEREQDIRRVGKRIDKRRGEVTGAKK